MNSIISYTNTNERGGILEIHQDIGLRLQGTDNKQALEAYGTFYFPSALTRTSPNEGKGWSYFRVLQRVWEERSTQGGKYRRQSALIFNYHTYLSIYLWLNFTFTKIMDERYKDHLRLSIDILGVFPTILNTITAIIAMTTKTMRQINSLSVYTCLAKYLKCFYALHKFIATFSKWCLYHSCYHKWCPVDLFADLVRYPQCRQFNPFCRHLWLHSSQFRVLFLGFYAPSLLSKVCRLIRGPQLPLLPGYDVWRAHSFHFPRYDFNPVFFLTVCI